MHVVTCSVCHLTVGQDMMHVMTYASHDMSSGLRAINVNMEEEKMHRLFERMDVDKVSGR